MFVTALGAEVTAHYNTQYGPLESLSKAYSNVQAVQANLSDEMSVANMFTAIAHAGPVQVLVVNHGIWPAEDVPLADLTLQRWNHTISTNLTSSFLVCREYLKRLAGATPEVKEKAAIVFIGSTAGKYGEAGHTDYAVTKSGECMCIFIEICLTVGNFVPSDDVWFDYVFEERDREDRSKGPCKYSCARLGENTQGGERARQPRCGLSCPCYVSKQLAITSKASSSNSPLLVGLRSKRLRRPWTSQTRLQCYHHRRYPVMSPVK